MLRSSIIIVVMLNGLLLQWLNGFAQEKKPKQEVLLHPDRFYRKFFPKLRIKGNPPDSLFVKTYPGFLSVGMHVLSPAVSVRISPRTSGLPGFDPDSKFRTNIADVIGFSGTYRLVAVGFAFLSNSGMNKADNYAPSHYRTATIKYNSSGLALQFKYLRVQGFTDVNQAGRGPNSQRPDMLNKELQFEGVYNFNWKKYSYIGPLTFSQRQMRSHAGVLMKVGVYYNRLSTDSTIINSRQQQYYENFNGVKAIQSMSVKIAPGLGGNLVFLRHGYLSIAGFASPDFYFYKYLTNPNENSTNMRAFVFTLEGKVSVGYQSQRLYGGLRYESEKRIGALQGIQLNSVYSYAGLELGYRFNTPRWVKGLYRKTMPPGS